MKRLRAALPSLNALFTLEAVARSGTFARAAKELDVTPAAVSRMIGRLKAHLDMPLFRRQPGGMILTEEGQLLNGAAARGFAGLEQALAVIEARRRRNVDTVTLSLSTGFTTHWLIPRMAAFKARFPNIELRFQLIMGAISGPIEDVDFGMRYVEGALPPHAIFVMPEILIPICAPGYPHPPDFRWPEPAGNMAGRLAPSSAEGNWSHPFLAEAADEAGAVQAALLGQGIALGWLNVIAHRLRSGALEPASRQVIRTGRKCCLISAPGQPLSHAASVVRDWMVSELQADADAIMAQLSLRD